MKTSNTFFRICKTLSLNPCLQMTVLLICLLTTLFDSHFKMVNCLLAWTVMLLSGLSFFVIFVQDETPG